MRASLTAGVERVETVTIDLPRTIEFLGEAMRVYSTPSMVRDIEYACLRLIEEHLDENESSVGIRIAVDHLAAALLGEYVQVRVKVLGVEGRKISLEAEVHDELEVIGRGEHVRFVIDVSRQAERLSEKAARIARRDEPAK